MTTPTELWALLSGPPGFHRLEIDGRVEWVDVADRERFQRFIRGCAETYTDLEVGAVPFKERDTSYVGAASVLWARAETPAQRQAVEDFKPSPTLVLAAGALRDVFWALEKPLSRGWALQANLRLAHALSTKRKHGEPWFSFTPPGCVTRPGKRAVVMELVSWTGAIYAAKDVVGGLEDPPDHRAAWKARQEAA